MCAYSKFKGVCMQEKYPDEPLALFSGWFAEAKTQHTEPSAMTLATVSSAGQPSARVVLMKAFGASGFVFYTNMTSRKAMELEQNPSAALCFYWPAILKQVRIEGTVHPLVDAEADAYFATRPRESQLAAWASQQSKTLPSREHLLQRYRELEATYAGQEVPRPPFWSGFRLVPVQFEFWIGHEFRLNERIQYGRKGDRWVQSLLYP